MIQQEQAHVDFSRQDANQLIPSVEAAYFGLIIKGKYLPKITSSVITAEYLLEVLFDKFYILDTALIRIGSLLHPVKNYSIIEELESLDLQKGVTWGFNSKHQPDKQWAINVLYTLKPNHHFFKNYRPEKYDMKKFTQAEIMKISALDISQGKRFSEKIFQDTERLIITNSSREQNKKEELDYR